MPFQGQWGGRELPAGELCSGAILGVHVGSRQEPGPGGLGMGGQLVHQQLPLVVGEIDGDQSRPLSFTPPAMTLVTSYLSWGWQRAAPFLAHWFNTYNMTTRCP